MKPKTAAISRHLVDTFLVIALAVTVALVSFKVVSIYWNEVLIRLSNADLLPFVVIIASSVLFGWGFPEKMMSYVRALKLWPRHWGLIIRTSLGGILTLAFAHYFDLVDIGRGKLLNLGFNFIIAQLSIFLVGTVAAYIHLNFNKTIKYNLKGKSASDDPICSMEENRFFENGVTAKRILLRLKSGILDEERSPNFALIGPYGSGKTSTCNLVEDIYRNESPKAGFDKLLFCRFEAWQFLTTDGAVKGLIELIVSKVEEHVDCSGLEKIPDRYLDALKACPGGWTEMFTSLLKKKQSSDEIVNTIQDVLLRIGKRIVVFVDDFDRLESKSEETQHAIAASLNQLQNLSNVQYILCVGPIRDGIGADLLKLTRYQELMPDVEGKYVIESLRKIRDKAISKECNLFCPWSFEGDPFEYYYQRKQLNSTLVSQLINLIETPRQLKSVERETEKMWMGGLSGEISWYDLLLMNVLKVCEPKIFEWVIREPVIFMEERISIGRLNEHEEVEKASNEILKKIEGHLIKKTKSRVELVQEILLDLFPKFMKGLGGLAQSVTRCEAQPWEQRISSTPIYAKSYFRRYFAGGVPAGEVQDQPTLQYIHNIIENGFEKELFQERYLETFEKLTNDINRFVWFSGLLPKELGREVCDCILEWMCDRNHWQVWEPADYVMNVMSDVKAIMENAGRFDFAQKIKSGPPEPRDSNQMTDWLDKWVDILAEKDVIVGMDFVRRFYDNDLSEKEIKPRLGKKLKGVFINKRGVFWEKTRGYRYFLAWTLELLKYGEGYQDIRDEVTKFIVEKAETDKSDEIADSFIMTLVNPSFTAGRPDLVEGYKFNVNKAEKTETYNMDMVLSLILTWKDRKFKNPLIEKAFEYLCKEYAEELESLDSQ